MTNNVKPNHLRKLYFKLLKFQVISDKYNFSLRDEELEFIDLITCNKIPLLNSYIEDTIDRRQYKSLLTQLNSNEMKTYKSKLIYLYGNIIMFQNEDDNNNFITSTQIKSLLKSSGKINSNIRSEIIINFKDEYPNLLNDMIQVFDFNLLKDIYIDNNEEITKLTKEYHLAHGMWNERISSEFELIEYIFIIKKYKDYTAKYTNKKETSKMSGRQLLLQI